MTISAIDLRSFFARSFIKFFNVSVNQIEKFSLFFSLISFGFKILIPLIKFSLFNSSSKSILILCNLSINLGYSIITLLNKSCKILLFILVGLSNSFISNLYANSQVISNNKSQILQN